MKTNLFILIALSLFMTACSEKTQITNSLSVSNTKQMNVDIAEKKRQEEVRRSVLKPTYSNDWAKKAIAEQKEAQQAKPTVAERIAKAKAKEEAMAAARKAARTK